MENEMDDKENQEAIHLTYRKSESERGASRGVYLSNDHWSGSLYGDQDDQNVDDVAMDNHQNQDQDDEDDGKLVCALLSISQTHGTGVHKSFHPTIRDGSTWSNFGARGEHGEVLQFSTEVFSGSLT